MPAGSDHWFMGSLHADVALIFFLHFKINYYNISRGINNNSAYRITLIEILYSPAGTTIVGLKIISLSGQVSVFYRNWQSPDTQYFTKRIIAKKMNILLPCMQTMLKLLFSPKQLPHNAQILRKYSSVDITPPIEQGCQSPYELENRMPNNYTGLTGADIFVMPSADDETSSESKLGNLLINKCVGGSFIVMRGMENVYIDTCQDAFIFIGPCHSTLFIRNCRNMKIRAIAQQLRIQNSQNIRIEGIVGVKPVLQDCKNIQFSSMACRIYEDLIWQIEQAKIDIFENQVYECYDFTPKKIANFVNLDAGAGDGDQDGEWEAKIEMNDLEWGFKNIYLPRLTSTKKSMLKKVYTENQIKTNPKIIITFTKMHFKQFLGALNCPQLGKNFTIIQKLPIEICLKILKSTSSYGQKIPILDQRPGDWYFILGKLSSKGNRSGMGLAVIEERDLIWRLFSNAS